MSAAENLLKENEGYGGLGVAVESAYTVGSRVVDEILENWEKYETQTPGTGG
jgi:purine nucleoside permease